MKRFFRLLLWVGCTTFLIQCHSKKNHDDDEANETWVDNEDGIREAQEMEFMKTADRSLGYIPKDRLITSLETLKYQRDHGPVLSGATGISALSWTERGSNSDAVGPSNGNGRISGSQVTSGRIKTILIDNTDASNHTVWVGAADGGIWKTTDITASPATWSVVNDFFSNLAVSAIAQNPANGNTMYFGTGESTFNLDAVRGGGIWKSTDHGVTWALLPNTTAFWNVTKIVCDAAGNVYVATVNSGNGSGLQRSINGGATWTDITPATTSTNSPRISEMELSSTGRLHVVKGYYNSAATECGYFFTDAPSTVTSATWTAPTTPYTPAIQYNCDLTSIGNTVYALPASSSFQTNQVWKSTDGGANWAVTATTPPVGGNTGLSSGQGWYNLAIAVDPTNANNVMVGGLNSYITTDAGATWTNNSLWVTGVGASLNYIHADHHVIAWSNNGIVLDGGDGGIFYSADKGVTFADRNVNLRLKQFYSVAIHPTSTNYFLAGAQDNGVHQLNGAGLTSSTEVTGGDGAFTHIDEDEPQFQFGSYVYNQYRKSLDGGNTWSDINFSTSAGLFINPTDYDDVNNKFYGAWTGGSFLRWDNPTSSGVGNGTSVNIGSFGSSVVSHTYVSKYTTNRVFFGTVSGKIVRVDNANASAAATDLTGNTMSGASVSCIVQGTNENNLLATFSNYGSRHVWATTTGGGATAWTDIQGNLPDIPVRWAMFYPEDNTKAILATEMGIYETALINGASTIWTQTSSFPTVRTDMLQYRFKDNTVAAATHGRGIWTSAFTPAQPYVRFSSSYTYSKVYTEATAASTGCRNYTDYTLNMHIDAAPTGAANVTLSIAGGATATQGIDYDFTTNGSFTSPSTVLTFPNGGTTDRPITIRVYDDAEVETTPESFTFNYTIGGGTNAVPAPSSSSYTFYIGDNDVAPTNTAIETVLNNNKTEHIANNGTYYFYSSTTSRLIDNISSASASLGCVTSNVFEAGNAWQSFASGQRSQKVIEVTPTTNSGASYTISLYYTAAELSGRDPAMLKIAKTNAATMAAANSGNTVSAPTTFTSYSGADFVFTATFTGFSKFFLIDASIALPVELISFSGSLNNQYHSALQWQTTNQYGFDHFEVERSYDGTSFSTAGTVPPIQNATNIQDYSFTDPLIAKAINYYRLKMIDKNGRFAYSGIIRVNNTKSAKFIELLGNPIRDNISFVISNSAKENVTVLLYTSGGQLVKQWMPGKVDGNILLPISNLPSGIYSLKISTDSKSATLQLKK